MPGTLKNGRYVVGAVLGSGAQGETLDALDTQTGRQVAIKRFFVRGAASWKDVELAEREARVLAAIDHPRLPRYVDHFEEEGALCLVMHRMEGESLAALRRRGGTLSRLEIVRLLGDVGELLDYLHGRAPPIIHRDIKPGNVIRRPDGSFALVDFGSVRDSLKPEGGSTVVGTFGYMAPEQFQGRALPQSDVYALGATVLGLLTGSEPEALPHRGLAIDVRAVLPRDPTFAGVLAKMLEPDPDRRAKRVGPLLAEVSPSSERTSPFGSAKHGAEPLVPGGFLIVLLVLGLVVARLSTGLLFRVFLPILLVLLSLFFGSGLRHTASRLRRLGERGDRNLRRAMEVVRGGSRRGWRPPQSPTRIRVQTEPATDRSSETVETVETVEPVGPRRRAHR